MKYIYLLLVAIVISLIRWYFARDGENIGLGILIVFFGFFIVNPLDDDSYRSGDENFF